MLNGGTSKVYNLNNTTLQETKVNEVSVDIIIFTIRKKELMALLIKRAHDPFKNMWAIPGGFIKLTEDLDEAAKRVLYERTRVENVYLEQLYCFSAPNRYPNARVITVCYFALLGSHDLKQAYNTEFELKNVEWHSVYNSPSLAFDHENIIKYGIKRLRERLEYTNVAFQLLTPKFTLTDLQKVYEIILNKPLDKRNFRKKILSLNILEELEEYTKSFSKRPARLYKFIVSPETSNEAILGQEDKKVVSF